MEKRPLGDTGIQLTILGFGGVVVTDTEQKEANNYVAEAYDSGINYFDIAPAYGNAQDRLGPALRGKRNNIFLACKTEKRDGADAAKELENSLKVMETDHFDLYQFHAISSLDEVHRILGPKGALETFVKAQKEGKIRYIGFSVHNEEAALALLDGFQFTSILYPINWVSLLTDQFGRRIMEKAIEKGTARLAIKAMAKTAWPKDLKQEDKKYQKCWYEPLDDEALAALALRYTLSQPVTAAIPPGDIRLFRTALKVTQDFKPLTPEETDQLKAMAQGLTPLFPLSE